MPQKAVQAHEIQNRITAPVGKQERADRARQQQDKADLAERFAKRGLMDAGRFAVFGVPDRKVTAVCGIQCHDGIIVGFGKKRVQQINENRKAAQMQREISKAHPSDNQ